MSYDCPDFYNDVVDAFAGAGLIGEALPDDESGIAVASDRLCTLARVLRTSIYNGLQEHLNPAPQPHVTLDWTLVYGDPAASFALRATMATFAKRDPVDALRDAELLVALLRAKLDRVQRLDNPAINGLSGERGEG